MATMMKEKRREKKKTKEKHVSKVTNLSEQPSISQVARFSADKTVSFDNITKAEEHKENTCEGTLSVTEVLKVSGIGNNDQNIQDTRTQEYSAETKSLQNRVDSLEDRKEEKPMHSLVTDKTVTTNYKESLVTSDVEVNYTGLSSTLERMTLPEASYTITPERISQLGNSYITSEEQAIIDPLRVLELATEEAVPSAPVFEEVKSQYVPPMELTREIRPKVQCMPLEEAVHVYCGMVFAEVRALSEREEAIVEAGPVSGPEHPLVDLLSTFRSSIIAIDNERAKIARGYAEEEKLRSTLWKVEKKTINVSEPCSCGATITFRATYEQAQLLKERLPVAKLRLDGLLKDVQESYCHYQHAALLAHCQIEELISETIQTNKLAIREALSLILQALRLSDGAPEALPKALQRWAAALATALVDTRDLRDLLFLLHHMFRQTRSVHWAAHAIRLQVVDSVTAAQAIAVLDLLLATPIPKLDTALECIEVEAYDPWEEVGRRGDGCAVREGALRERDLLAALRAMPLRSLLATLVMFTQQDVRQARAQWWGEGGGGGGVLRAACGVRALLRSLSRASSAHAHYARLRRALRTLAVRTLRALAALHLHCENEYPYSKDQGLQIEAELEASFSAGFTMFHTDELHRLPATLLSDDTAKEYCLTFMTGLHDKTAKQLESLSITIPVVPCDVCVSIVTQAAVDRTEDHELARMVLEFLFQIGIKRKPVQCKGTCDVAARECLPKLIDAHPYLHTFGLHILADLNEAQPLDANVVKALHVHKWRPNNGEVKTVLDDWAQRCPHLLQYLLLDLDYTPYVGLSEEVQLAVGEWMCAYAGAAGACPVWAWRALRRLRLRCARPPPPHTPPRPLDAAFALLATSWGHSIPLICSEGISVLCTLASTRVLEAVHCLAPVMLAMAHSPESISLTPKFSELFSVLLSSGPSLVQRALGRAGAGGPELLLRLMLQMLHSPQCGGVSRGSILSAWLHALWREPPGPGCAPLLEAAGLASREWALIDSHAMLLLLSEHSKEYVCSAVRSAAQAPLVCESVLRAHHAQRELRTQLHAALLPALRAQRLAGQRIHVDNALNKIGFMMSSEELTIYRTVTAGLVAPFHHPSHLTLWRLFFHLYLQRSPDDLHESSPPIGPLFFSGLIKSRTLVQIKKRLQDTITYHQTEAESLKNRQESIKTIDIQSTSNVANENSTTIDDNYLPALSISDLTGESSESSDSDDSASEEEEIKEMDKLIEDEDNSEKKNVYDLICYHTAAEKLIRAYSRWLDEGDKVRALPHHADIARFIPEQAMEAAWQLSLSRTRPPPSEELDSFPLPAPPPPAPAAPTPRTPFNIAVHNIMKITEYNRRSNRSTIKSPVEEINFNDSRTLLALVDKHLKNIEGLAQEWCSEVGRVSSLDGALWELVRAARVRRPAPPVRKQCANKCKPRNIIIPVDEWCISTGAERGIQENRASARACLRRVSRPRPFAARTAAALYSVARRVSSIETARRVVERAWSYCSSSARCAQAHITIATLVSQLAERWLCAEGRVCAELVSRWSRASANAPQQALCGALVAPRRLPRAHWPLVYAALLHAHHLPEHTLFSYLSKFDMSWWSQAAEPSQRQELLQSLLTAAQRWGPTPQTQHQAVLELLGVHTRAILTGSHLCAYVMQCVRASVDGRLPAGYWEHLVRAVNDRAAEVAFDQVGNVLREMGLVWWEARMGARNHGGCYGPYGAHTGRLLYAMLRAFVASAVQLSYAPERVSWFAWHALQEAWSPWITPHNATPLLPSAADDEAYTTMLAILVETITQIMLDCPGTEEYLLQQVFEWSVQVFASTRGGGQEARVQMSALLAVLDHLPWTDHQWFYGNAIQVALQICSTPDKEITSWCCKTFRDTSAETLVKGVSDDQLAPSLAALLYLLTVNTMSHSLKMLVEATRLPWWRLPEVALDEALERFFIHHHNPVQPYHELPQYKVVLYASSLIVHEDSPGGGGGGGGGRGRAVSQCVRAHAAPTLHSHVAHNTSHLLDTITQLAPHLENNGDELEELLSRAVVIMCMEPAATAALPVWVEWVGACPPRCARACVSAAASLTTFEYFAPLADAAIRALLNSPQSPGWEEARVRVSTSPWRECGPLCARARLHAALAVLRRQDTVDLRAAFNALHTADINFLENEAIVAVWICLACRVCRECSGSGEEAECRVAGSKLLARWADPPRRSLLKVVTLQTDSDRPTARHRLLCRLAQCILAPDSDTVRAYETACVAVFGSATPGDVITWAKTPHPKRLPRLAITLLPKYEVYFTEELDLAPEPN